MFLTLSEQLHFGRLRAVGILPQPRQPDPPAARSQTRRTAIRSFKPPGHPHPDRSQTQEATDRAVRGATRRIARARAQAEQVSGELRLGLLLPSSGGPRLQQIIELFESRIPGASVSIRDLRYEDPLGPLRRGEIDLMACRLPINQPDLTVGPVLASDRRILAVAIDHPLATRESISVEDLADCQAHDAGGTRASTPTRSSHRGRLAAAESPDDTSALLRPPKCWRWSPAAELVHPTISSFPDHFRHPGVTFVPIRDMPSMNSGLVWRSAERSAAIRAFAQAAKDTLGAPVRDTHRRPSPAGQRPATARPGLPETQTRQPKLKGSPRPAGEMTAEFAGRERDWPPRD